MRVRRRERGFAGKKKRVCGAARHRPLRRPETPVVRLHRRGTCSPRRAPSSPPLLLPPSSLPRRHARCRRCRRRHATLRAFARLPPTRINCLFQPGHAPAALPVDFMLPARHSRRVYPSARGLSHVARIPRLQSTIEKHQPRCTGGAIAAGRTVASLLISAESEGQAFSIAA